MSVADRAESRLNVGIGLFTMTPRLMTGTASYVRAVVGGLADAKHGIDPVLLVNRLMRDLPARWALPALRVAEIRSIPVRDKPALRLALIAHALAFPDKVRRQVPGDIQVVHYPLTLPFPNTNQPRVVTLHDVQHHDLPQFFTPQQRRWRRYAYDDSARSANVVVTPCEHTKLRAVERLGIDPDRIEAIFLGVDHTQFTASGADDEFTLRDLHLPARFLLFPAALWPHKNHRGLIDAIALLADREIELILTGPSLGEVSGLMAYAARRGVANRVHHLGFVSEEQLAALYRRAVMVVFPSLYEGFGVPPIEAMACGCPVAASNAASLPEVCGNAAALFDPRSPADIAATVDSVLADPALRRELARKGVERAAVFTWHTSAARHAEVYWRAATQMAGVGSSPGKNR